MLEFFKILGEHLGTVIIILNLILGIILVTFEHRNPSSMWAWLLVLYFMPVVGFILYLLIGHDLYRRHKFQIKQQEDQIELARHQRQTLDKGGRMPNVPLRYQDMIRLFLKNSHSVISRGNSVDLFTDGEDKFQSLLNDLKGARDSIYIQYYIFHGDDLGHRVMEILKEKAKEGLDVRLLTDGLGVRKDKKSFFQELKSAGGHVAIFFPPWLPLMSTRVNFRNHRKIVVIDHKIGYIGGFNVGDEYLGKGKLGHWRDTHLRIQGPSVDDLMLRFLVDWNYASKDKLTKIGYYRNQPGAGVYVPCQGKMPHEEPQFKNVILQIVGSGPDTKMQSIRDGYLKMITEAEKRVYIQSPYLILDETMTQVLRIAAMSGIDVKIIIPLKPDHLMVDGANMLYVGDLIDAGVKVYRYKNGFIHSKTMIADDALSSVGTANMDMRSFKLNFEVNAFIYDPSVNEALTKAFEEDLKDCEEITFEWYQKRPVSLRIKENLMKLISPLL